MANKNMIDFPSGLTFHTERKKSQFFKDLKKILTGIHSPFLDCTCLVSDGNGGFVPATTDSLPVRVNPETLITEYFNGNVWTSVDLNQDTVAAAVTASTTQTQVGGTAITKQFNNVTVSATAGNAVTLPTASTGKIVVIKNSGATPISVFPASADSIDALAVNLAVLVPVGAQVLFTAINSTVWISTNVPAKTASAVNTTATVTAAQLATGLITSTSAATVTATLPTATAIGTQISATQGRVFNFLVDNSAGANIVTVAVGSGITAVSPVVVTGSATLTVAAASVGAFTLIFTSSTAAILARTS